MTRTKKDFDAVGMMRSIRYEVSTAIEAMTLEQELGVAGITGTFGPLC